MSARPERELPWPALLCFEPMRSDEVDAIARIEARLYTFPWTIGNFRDSLAAGYSAWVLRDGSAQNGPSSILGYFLLMVALDDAHLLNISVATEYQGMGFGLALLNKSIETARDHRARTMILEVRPSNVRALSFYERHGFERIGVRRDYYPVSSENRIDREDAIVMQRNLR